MTLTVQSNAEPICHPDIVSGCVTSEVISGFKTHMAESKLIPATIEVWRSHGASLCPVVPEVQARLQRRGLGFETGGALGHTMYPVISTVFADVITSTTYDDAKGRFRRRDLQVMPQGMVPEVVGWLKELGYSVTVQDHREDSQRWVLGDDWKKSLPKAQREIVRVLGEEKALRVIANSDETIAKTISAVVHAYPEARIAVAVFTHNQLRRIQRRLTALISNEPLGLYTSKKKCPARVSVGLIGQFPWREKGYFDLLVLPYAESTVGDLAIRAILLGEYRRILSFTTSRWTRDENVNWRLKVVSRSVYPPEKATTPITAVMLPTHGTKPEKLEDAFDAKKKLYWNNPRRNRRIAEITKRLALATTKAIQSVTDNPTLTARMQHAAKKGVVVLVETPVHARELAKHLPGWAISTGGELEVKKPGSGCGTIITELSAQETVLRSGILIRATGTKWPLPDIHWPVGEDVEHAFLIDFWDEYHPAAARNAQSRRDCYKEAGMEVWVPDSNQNTTEPHGCLDGPTWSGRTPGNQS